MSELYRYESTPPASQSQIPSHEAKLAPPIPYAELLTRYNAAQADIGVYQNTIVDLAKKNKTLDDGMKLLMRDNLGLLEDNTRLKSELWKLEYGFANTDNSTLSRDNDTLRAINNELSKEIAALRAAIASNRTPPPPKLQDPPARSSFPSPSAERPKPKEDKIEHREGSVRDGSKDRGRKRGREEDDRPLASSSRFLGNGGEREGDNASKQRKTARFASPTK